jgi:hypothetical protein
MQRVIVFGGRDYTDKAFVYWALQTLAKQGAFFVIEGGAAGPDTFAKEWALDSGYPYAEVPAHWDTYRKKAGPVRNDWMTRLYPTYGVGFPGNNGTADMANRLHDLKVPVWRPAIQETPPPFPKLQLIAIPV